MHTKKWTQQNERAQRIEYAAGVQKPMKLTREEAQAKQSEILAQRRLTYDAKRGIIPLRGGGLVKVDMQFFAEKDIEKQESASLIRAMRKYQKRIDEHKNYILDPRSHCPDWDSFSEQKRSGLIRHWQKEISNFEESIQNRIDELKKRGEYDE